MLCGWEKENLRQIFYFTVSRKNRLPGSPNFEVLITNYTNKMAIYRISGIWIDDDQVITHYAFHEIKETQRFKGLKISKAEAIKLLSIRGNEAMTWIWDYKRANWIDGAKVEVVANSYLRTYHDNIVVDNLSHLIDYDWLQNT
jgi:hypothetical protein